MIVQDFGGVHHLVEGHSGNKAGGHAASQRRTFGEASEGCVAGKGYKGGSQNWHTFLEKWANCSFSHNGLDLAGSRATGKSFFRALKTENFSRACENLV
jgi:hypothetical protein